MYAPDVLVLYNDLVVIPEHSRDSEQPERRRHVKLYVRVHRAAAHFRLYKFDVHYLTPFSLFTLNAVPL